MYRDNHACARKIQVVEELQKVMDCQSIACKMQIALVTAKVCAIGSFEANTLLDKDVFTCHLKVHGDVLPELSSSRTPMENYTQSKDLLLAWFETKNYRFVLYPYTVVYPLSFVNLLCFPHLGKDTTYFYYLCIDVVRQQINEWSW